MKFANENDKDIWYVYAYDSEGDFVLIKDYDDKSVKPLVGYKFNHEIEQKSTVTTTDIMENAKVFYEKIDAERLIRWIKNNWVILNDEMVDYNDLQVGYKDKYDNIYDVNTERCVLINSDGDEIEESMQLREAKEILKNNGYKILNEGYSFKKEVEFAQADLLAVYSFDIVTAAFDDYYDKWSKGLGKKPKADDIAMACADWIDSLSDEELEEIENGDESYELDEALEGPATSKQLWTLFCLTKQDYRNKNISKEEASKLIGELLAKKKNGENTTERKPKVEEDSPVKVGDIYHRSFGYDMTLNTFYKVLSVRGKKAQVVEVGTKWVSGEQGYTGSVIAVPEKEIPDTITTALIRTDNTNEPKLRIQDFSKYETFYKWNGKPCYENHMD